MVSAMRADRPPGPIMPPCQRGSRIVPRGFDTRAPRSCIRLREMRCAGNGEPRLTPALGEFTRVLAASRPGGTFVSLGHGADEAGAWIVDGMDLASRLVVVVGDGDEAESLRTVLGDDLRVTVHVQEAAAFLDDVREHRFDLITDLSAAVSARLVKLELGRLAPGAFFVTRQSSAALSEMISQSAAEHGARAAMDADGLVLARLPEELGITLITRRNPRPQAKRRGGRRARAGVTPLFSSRPRPPGD